MNEPLKLLAVLAHPDDETFGLGGMLARYAAEGIATYLVCATRGERGWNGPATWTSMRSSRSQSSIMWSIRGQLCFEYLKPGQLVLDAGIGTGLSAQLFAKAGLAVYGMDFAPAMLDLCRAKGLAVELAQHDLTKVPWPYPSGAFDALVCCGVLHFIAALDGIFGEAARALSAGGVFVFSTRQPLLGEFDQQPYERHWAGEFEIISHAPAHVEALLAQHAFRRLKLQRCFVGEDVFLLWVVCPDFRPRERT